MLGASDLSGADEVDGLVAALTRGSADGPESRVLDPLVGRWDTTTEWEPLVGRGIRRSTGTMEAGWIMGGRALEMHTFDEERREVARVILAFDPSAGDYVAFSVTVLSSFFGVERGAHSPERHTLALDGREPLPARGVVIDYRRTFHFVDADTFTVDISYPGAPLDDYGPMLVTYHRQV